MMDSFAALQAARKGKPDRAQETSTNISKVDTAAIEVRGQQFQSQNASEQQSPCFFIFKCLQLLLSPVSLVFGAIWEFIKVDIRARPAHHIRIEDVVLEDGTRIENWAMQVEEYDESFGVEASGSDGSLQSKSFHHGGCGGRSATHDYESQSALRPSRMVASPNSRAVSMRDVSYGLEADVPHSFSQLTSQASHVDFLMARKNHVST